LHFTLFLPFVLCFKAAGGAKVSDDGVLDVFRLMFMLLLPLQDERQEQIKDNAQDALSFMTTDCFRPYFIFSWS